MAAHSVAAADQPTQPGASPRPAWTTPFVTGSPEPPPPYKSVRIFPKVQFKNPITIEMPPGDPRWWVSEGSGRLLVIQPTADGGGRADLIADLTTDLKLKSAEGEPLRVTYVYGVAFHPKFAENHELFLAYTVVPPKAGVHLPDGTRVSRFKVIPGDVPKIDLASEELLLTFLEGGHNGACLEFGPDGCLYISTGDAGDASPPDMRNTGQDTTDLLASILRIDVDHRDEGKSHAIPKDNPFVGTAGFRPEIWAYGFRNPWKMSFDRATGDLWVADIGWELWEMVHRVERGGNYGWSVMEGPQPVRFDLPAGPTPISPPLLALPHTAAASVTGGFVYRGRKFPELEGKYIFGDWETHRLWSLKAPKSRDDASAAPLELVDLTTPSIRIIDFGQDHDGEICILDYDTGMLHALEHNDPVDAAARPFPRRLTETGLFASVTNHNVAPGVMPFQIAAEQWQDGATAERFVAVPNDDAISAYRIAKQTPSSMFRRHFEFPKDSVLVKTLSLPDDGSGTPPKRVETQLLHFDGLQWQGYSYKWNDAQTDAELVPADGDEAVFSVNDERAPGGSRTLHWTYSSRSQCMTCHTPWAESTLAFNTGQLLTPLNESKSSRLDDLESVGLIARQQTSASPPRNLSRWDEESVLVPPFDERFPLDKRARSYLDANCSHCHRFGGGGTAQIDLRAGISLDKTKTVNEVPTKGDLELPNTRIIIPGNPYRSVLFLRMTTCGRGRMPHLASEVPDSKGLALIEEWIRAMEPKPGMDEGMYARVLEAVAKESSADTRQALIAPILNDRAGAVYLARRLDALPAPVRQDVVATVAASTIAGVRDLFSVYLPASPVDRVGQTPRPRLILQKTGDAQRGKSLYQTSTTLNCRTCHRVGTEGGQAGPELTHVARLRRREELLDSLLNPSAIVDPKFATFVAQLNDGRVLTGVIVERNADMIHLRDAKGELQRIAHQDIDAMKPQRASLMPEGLLKDLTLQEAADLLAFLESLR